TPKANRYPPAERNPRSARQPRGTSTIRRSRARAGPLGGRTGPRCRFPLLQLGVRRLVRRRRGFRGRGLRRLGRLGRRRGRLRLRGAGGRGRQGAVGGGPRRAAGTGVALARPGGPRRRRRLGVGRLAGLALRPLLLVPVVVRPAPGAVGRRRAVAGGTAARHRTPATRRLVTPLPGRPGRPGAPVGTVRADTHAARGSGDGDQRGGQADGYVQAAHGATSDGSTGST